IRSLYEREYQEYKRIQSLPIKSRIGRLSQVNNKVAKVIIGQRLESTELCYLWIKMKEEFKVSDRHKCVELTFYQAVKLFKASKQEEGRQIAKDHYQAVNIAIQNFSRVFNVVHTFDEYDRTNLSVQERNAVNFLNSIKTLRKNFPQELSEE